LSDIVGFYILLYTIIEVSLCSCTRGDANALSKTEKFLESGQIMREESQRLESTCCQPLPNTLCNKEFYRVQSTGAIVTLNSSVALIYLFCSKLPSDESVFFLR
jgi:endoribonuclease Dicer